MARKCKAASEPLDNREIRPAISSDAREKQLINMAMTLAEQQLRDGTASSQVITHYLKLATQKDQTELELLALQKELVKAKTEALEAAQRNEEMFAEAIRAMAEYSGEADDEDYAEDGYYEYD